VIHGVTSAPRPNLGETTWPTEGNSYPSLSGLQRQVDVQRAINASLSLRNDEFAVEVRSLHEGREAIEERARYELNMIRGDELFFQFVPTGKGAPAPDAKPDARK
jgi:cell division protein FtsB